VALGLAVAAGCASEARDAAEGGGGAGAGGATPIASVTSGGGATPRAGFPVPDWPTGDPAAHGFDPARLEDAAGVAAGLGSHCLLVVRHGVVVGEWYWAGNDAATPQKSWSLAKSYTSALVGIAIERGDLGGLDTSVASLLPGWKNASHEGITVGDLLSMTSGLTWSTFQDYVQMAALAEDHTAFALDVGVEDPPGQRWIYNNAAVQLFEPIFRAATGATIEAYAESHLWSRLGMTASWAHDSVGHPTAYASVLASCRDHARFGYAYLRGGLWVDGPVVPPAFVAASLTPSQSLNRAYGYLWWLNGETPALDAMMEPWPGPLVPFAPPDLFAARGFGNQFIDVVPSLDLLVVRFGDDPFLDLSALSSDQRFEKHDAILAPILEAIVD
jgi:CubicO group peptidase (beta-lactamase class C family)